jgi:hypothetical protein
MVPVSFRRTSDWVVYQIQRQYATGFYTQAELADKHEISISLISKICRCSDTNVDAAMRNIRKRLRNKRWAS